MVVRSIADHVPSGGDGDKLTRSLPAGVAARADRVVSSLPSATRSIRLAPAVAEARMVFDLLERWIEGPELVADALDG